jgi:hypothetical protein
MRYLIAALLLIGGVAHAELSDVQCYTRANQWHALLFLSDESPNMKELSKFTSRELENQQDEMRICFLLTSDPHRTQNAWYKPLTDVYELEIRRRTLDFLARHNLMAQYYGEDEKGAR